MVSPSLNPPSVIVGQRCDDNKKTALNQYSCNATGNGDRASKRMRYSSYIRCRVQKILYHWLGYRIGLLNITKAKTSPLFGNKAAVQKTKILACSFLTGQAAVTSRTRSFLTGQLSTAQD